MTQYEYNPETLAAKEARDPADPNAPFWIVLRDPSKPNATKRHSGALAAREEAERLARKEDRRFYVCTVTPFSYVEPQEPPVVWTKI